MKPAFLCVRDEVTAVVLVTHGGLGGDGDDEGTGAAGTRVASEFFPKITRIYSMRVARRSPMGRERNPL